MRLIIQITFCLLGLRRVFEIHLSNLTARHLFLGLETQFQYLDSLEMILPLPSDLCLRFMLYVGSNGKLMQVVRLPFVLHWGAYFLFLCSCAGLNYCFV